MLNKLLNNNKLSFLIKLLLILYIIVIIIRIPNQILLLYDNKLFKLIFLSLIFYVSQINIFIAILLAISYILPLYKLNEVLSKSHIHNKYISNIVEEVIQNKPFIGGNIAEQLRQLNMKRLGKKYSSWAYMAGRIAFTYLLNKYTLATGQICPPFLGRCYNPILYIPSDKEDNILIDTQTLPPGFAWVPNKYELEELTQRILSYNLPWPQIIAGEYFITQQYIAIKLLKKYFHPETGKFYDIWNSSKETETDSQKIKEAKDYINNKPKTDVSIDDRGYNKTGI